MTFPGVRSDSDMYTYGFSFNPWKGKIIGEGKDIKKYLVDTAEKFDIKSAFYSILKLIHLIGPITNGQ
jgi:cation diffusion facilitator CzcD-associated flavoprotein CzcO